LTRPKLISTHFAIADAIRSARRPVARLAGIAAIAIFAVCFARSDARVAADSYHALDLSNVVVSSYAANANGVVASVQEMLTTPKTDGYNGSADTQTRVAPLHVETVIHARRIFQTAAPEIRYSAALPPGKRRTLRPGQHGVEWVTERVTLWNDVVVDRHVISREVVRDAKPAVIMQGSPTTLAQLESALGRNAFAATMTMVATAYTAASASAYPTGYTATGVPAHRGVVAVDPRLIPLGTTVFVPGYGVAVAADTGGAIIGHRIDLCMDAYGEAVNFGRRTVQVYVLKR
jgi:3D (Asp-Asp-Asp) domain-containing protein